MKCAIGMNRCGWELQWLIQDVRQMYIFTHAEQKTPGHIRGDVTSKPRTLILRKYKKRQVISANCAGLAASLLL